MAFRKIQTTNLDSLETTFDDPIMVVNRNSGSYTTDIGWLGKTGASSYSGIVKDSDDGKFYVIDSVTLASQSVNDVNPLTLTKGTLEAYEFVGNLTGDVTGNVTGDVTFQTTMVLPKGNTAARPNVPVEGQMWFNTDTKMFEGYDGTNWVQLVPSTFTSTP